jgi:hypothetical protein
MKKFSRYYVAYRRKGYYEDREVSSIVFLRKDGTFGELDKDSKSFATRFFANLYMKTHKRLCHNCEVLSVYFSKI